MRYRSCRPDDADLRTPLRELAAERRRFGYRRLHIMLRRDGIEINRKEVQRLYPEERLTVRRCREIRRAVGAWAPAPVLTLANSAEAWTLRTTNFRPGGAPLCYIVDDVTLECLRAVVEIPITETRCTTRSKTFDTGDKPELRRPRRSRRLSFPRE